MQVLFIFYSCHFFLKFFKKVGEHVDEKTRKTITAVIDQGLPKFNTTEEGAFVLYEPFYSEGRLIILGGGHIAKPLNMERLLLTMGEILSDCIFS